MLALKPGGAKLRSSSTKRPLFISQVWLNKPPVKECVSMELLFLIFLFFLKSSHLKGFSHCEQEGWNSLFIIADQEGLDVIIDGFPTGLQAPCKVFVEPGKSDLYVELRRSGYMMFGQHVNLVEKESFILGRVSRRLHLFA